MEISRFEIWRDVSEVLCKLIWRDCDGFSWFLEEKLEHPDGIPFMNCRTGLSGHRGMLARWARPLEVPASVSGPINIVYRLVSSVPPHRIVWKSLGGVLEPMAFWVNHEFSTKSMKNHQSYRKHCMSYPTRMFQLFLQKPWKSTTISPY